MIRGITAARGKSASSEVESESDSYSTAGYTSGAFATDEERGVASFSQGAESDTNNSTGGTQTKERGNVRNSGHATVPSPGYIRAFGQARQDNWDHGPRR